MVVDKWCSGRHTYGRLLALHRWRWVGDKRIGGTLQRIFLRWPFYWGWRRQWTACSRSAELVPSSQQIRRNLTCIPYTFSHNRCWKAATCRGYLQWLSGMPCGKNHSSLRAQKDWSWEQLQWPFLLPPSGPLLYHQDFPHSIFSIWRHRHASPPTVCLLGWVRGVPTLTYPCDFDPTDVLAILQNQRR